MNQIACYIPKWLETLPQDHDMKRQMIQIMKEEVKNETRKDGWQDAFIEKLKELPFVKSVFREAKEGENPQTEAIQISVKEEYYYTMLSEMAGMTIEGEYQLISLIRDFSIKKKEYEEIHDAMHAVRETGYGVILPQREEVKWEEPVVTHSGNRYGVKMKAISPTIHLIRAEIDTEISPIVGTQNQANDLMQYLREGESKPDGIWEITIFGKTVEQLMQEGMAAKLNQFSEENRMKIQKVISRVLDESKNGMICLII